MSSTPTNRTVNIYINSTAANKTLADLNARADKLTESIRKGEKAGKDMTKAVEQLGQTKKNIADLEQVISGKMAPSLNLVRNRAAELRRELERMSQDAPEYAAKFEEYKKVTGTFRSMQQEIRGVDSALKGAGDRVSAFWKEVKTVAVGTLIGNTVQSLLEKVSGYFSGIVSGNVKLADSFADIQKSTGLSAKEVEYLNSALSKLDTRTATADLREIAVGLGQINQAASPENVAAIDRLVVALGDEFGGGPKEITTSLGVLRNNLQDIKTENYGNDILHIGNALNLLGAEGLATAPVVTDFANRMSGVAVSFNLSSGQILGTAAAMQELGIPAERGSTAFIRLMQKMSTETETYAHVASYAGISAKDFIDLLNKDMLAALGKVAEGVRAAGTNNVQLGAILKDLDADGSGAGEVLSKLGTNADLLAGKIKLASGALTNTSSITEEFNLKNNNLAADVAKLEKAFAKLSTSPAVNNFLKSVISASGVFITILSFLSGHLGSITTFILAYAAAWTLANGPLIVQNALLLYYNARILLSKGLLLGLNAAQTAYTVGLTLLTRVYALATPVIAAFNTVFAATPFGAIITLLGFLGAALTVSYTLITRNTGAIKEMTKAKLLNNEVDTNARKSIAETQAKITTLTAVINDNNASQYVRVRALNELKAIAPEYLGNLTQENIRLAEGKKLLEEYNTLLFNKASLEAAQSLQSDKMKRDLELQEAEYRLQQKIAQGKTDISDLSDQEQEFLGGFRKAAPFSASVVDALKGSKNSSAALEALNTIRDQRKALANEIDITNNIVKDRYQKLQQTIKKGPTDPADPSKVKGSGYTPEMTDAEKQRMESLEQRRQEFLEKLKALEAEAAAAAESSDEAERQRIVNKYALLESEAQKLFAETGELSRQLARLNASEQQELDNLLKKQFAKNSSKEYDDTLAKVKAHFNQERQLVDQAYLDGEVNKEEHGNRMLQLDEDEYDARALAAEDYAATVKKAETDLDQFQSQASQRKVTRAENEAQKSNASLAATLDLAVVLAKAGSKAELDAKIEVLKAKQAADKKYYGETSAQAKLIDAQTQKAILEAHTNYITQKIQSYVGLFQGVYKIFQDFSSINSQREQQQLDDDNAANDQKRDNLQKQLDAKKISQQKYDKEIAKLDEDRAKKEHALKVKQFNRDKQSNLIQGGIDLAMGISDIWSKHADNPILAGILTGILSAVNLTEMAFVAAQPAPKYAKGRRPVGSGGIPDGPSHDNNGIKLVDGITGRVVGEMEGDEAILSKATVRNNPELANALLDSSMYNGGRRVNIPWLYSQGASLNTRQAISALQFNRMFAAGGFSDGSGRSSASVATAAPMFSDRDRELMQQFIQGLQGGVKAYVTYNDLDKVNRDIADLKKAGSANPYA